ncbi:MAG: PA2169 family four-helix-bundle protein [Acidobacteriota bacterium]|nr:PA2169 family four-helix-bundle protein [Acidobacteriota bacterium]
MPDSSSRAILNHLIETCKDSESGFRHAAELVSDPAFKTLFTDLARRRSQVAAELQPHAQRFGGSEAADGTTAASLHRKWMDVRDNWSGHDDRAILAETRRGNSMTVAAFRDALAGVLPASVRDMVERQYAEVCRSEEALAENLT